MLNKITVGVAALALIVGIVAYTKTPTRIVGSQGSQGTQGIQGPRGATGPVGPQGPAGRDGSNGKTLGALTSPDLPYPYISVGGVRKWSTKLETLIQATTTVCAIQSPAATSTLRFGSIRFVIASSTVATRATIAKATTPWATTTSLGAANIASNGAGTILATTTQVVPIDDVIVFAPSTYFVVGLQGGVGSFTPTGTCVAEFVEN